MSWDQAQKEALARANSSTTLRWGLELRHSTFPAHIRMVDHDQDIDLDLEATAPANPSTTQTFLATGFRFTEPELTVEPDPTVTIEIDGVSGSLQPYLRAAIQTNEPIALTVRGFMYDVESGDKQVLRILHLQMRRSVTTMTSISAEFGYTNAANQAFPSQIYDAKTNPGLL